jgi:hypothetical protein
VTAFYVLISAIVGALVFAALGLAVCAVAVTRYYNAVDFVTVHAACAGAVVGAVAGAAQTLTTALRGKSALAMPVPPAEAG